MANKSLLHSKSEYFLIIFISKRKELFSSVKMVSGFYQISCFRLFNLLWTLRRSNQTLHHTSFLMLLEVTKVFITWHTYFRKHLMELLDFFERKKKWKRFSENDINSNMLPINWFKQFQSVEKIWIISMAKLKLNYQEKDWYW